MPAYLYYNQIDNEDTMRLYMQGLTDAEIAKKCRVPYGTVNNWRNRKGLPPNKKAKVDDGYPQDVKKCLACLYWQPPHGSSTSFRFCHHLLDTGKRRKRGDGKECLSYTKRRTERRREDA